VLQPSSVSGTSVLQSIKKCKGLRVSGSEYKQGFLKFLSNALGGEGSERACVNFIWSEALTGQVRVACLAAIFAWAFTMQGIRRFKVKVGTSTMLLVLCY